ncbi:MAG TPA: hypothetical protein ENI27_10860 [bacterium]|nr:hypothetical protein [bacterium]
MIKFFKDGDNMSIATSAKTEVDFVNEVAWAFDEMILEGFFKHDWGFQLLIYLPWIFDIILQLRAQEGDPRIYKVIHRGGHDPLSDKDQIYPLLKESTQEKEPPETTILEAALPKKESKEKLDLSCKNCKKPISGLGKTGLCRSCAMAVNRSRIREKDIRYCESCQKEKIAQWNKSGLCQKCSIIALTEKRNKKKEKAQTVVTKPPREGNCSKCKKKFKLKNWQNSALHWCPTCRKSPGYKDFTDGDLE